MLKLFLEIEVDNEGYELKTKRNFDVFNGRYGSKRKKPLNIISKGHIYTNEIVKILTMNKKKQWIDDPDELTINQWIENMEFSNNSEWKKISSRLLKQKKTTSIQ